MTIESFTPVHRRAAIGAGHTDSSALPAKPDAGAFTRSGNGAKSADHADHADQGFGRRAAGVRGNNMLAMPSFSMTGPSLKTIANIYRYTAPNGAPLHFQLFGKPATLGKVGDNLVFRGKYSANPAEPSGMIMFKNGKINFAQSGYPGRDLTPKQQAFMVQALVDKMSQRILNHHA